MVCRPTMRPVVLCASVVLALAVSPSVDAKNRTGAKSTDTRASKPWCAPEVSVLSDHVCFFDGAPPAPAAGENSQRRMLTRLPEARYFSPCGPRGECEESIFSTVVSWVAARRGMRRKVQRAGQRRHKRADPASDRDRPAQLALGCGRDARGAFFSGLLHHHDEASPLLLGGVVECATDARAVLQARRVKRRRKHPRRSVRCGIRGSRRSRANAGADRARLGARLDPNSPRPAGMAQRHSSAACEHGARDPGGGVVGVRPGFGLDHPRRTAARERSRFEAGLSTPRARDPPRPRRGSGSVSAARSGLCRRPPSHPQASTTAMSAMLQFDEPRA